MLYSIFIIYLIIGIIFSCFLKYSVTVNHDELETLGVSVTNFELVLIGIFWLPLLIMLTYFMPLNDK